MSLMSMALNYGAAGGSNDPAKPPGLPDFSEPPSKPVARKFVYGKTCLRCRLDKQTCDHNMPCARCVNIKEICVPQVYKKRGPAKGSSDHNQAVQLLHYVHSLEARLSETENALSNVLFELHGHQFAAGANIAYPFRSPVLAQAAVPGQSVEQSRLARLASFDQFPLNDAARVNLWWGAMLGRVAGRVGMGGGLDAAGWAYGGWRLWGAGGAGAGNAGGGYGGGNAGATGATGDAVEDAEAGGNEVNGEEHDSNMDVE